MYNSMRGDDMKRDKTKNYHLLKAYKAIKNGISTLSEISSILDLNLGSTSIILKMLLNLKIIEKENIHINQGHPIHKYRVSDTHHCLYIDKRPEIYALVSITATGFAYTHAKFPKRFMYLGPSNSLSYALKNLRRNEFHKYCRSIYLAGDNLDEIKPDNDIIITSEKDLILSNYQDKEKIYYIKLNNKYYISVYSHVHETETTYKNVKKVLPTVEYIEITDENKYLIIFESLKNKTDKLIENYLLELKFK